MIKVMENFREFEEKGGYSTVRFSKSDLSLRHLVSGYSSQNILKTRKHSIRMHATCFPTVFRGIPGPISGVGGVLLG